MLHLLVCASVAAAAPDAARLEEAAHAIDAGRFDQARTMITAAMSAGTRGDEIDRLLADLAFASRNNAEAFARYKLLLVRFPDDPALLERAATAAARLGKVDDGARLADRATRAPKVSWRAWSARGVIADMQRDFPTADSAYEQALMLSPHQPDVLNNLGWSRLMRGDWAGAVAPLEEAAKLMPRSRRVANNLELARAAVAADLPHRRAGEDDTAFAARLNDAGMLARLQGDQARAIAAFSRAIEASGSWYERAANNLRLAGGKE